MFCYAWLSCKRRFFSAFKWSIGHNLDSEPVTQAAKKTQMRFKSEVQVQEKD